MSTARFGVCVSALTPFVYRAFRTKRIVSVLALRGQQLANVHVAQVYPDRSVDQPVDHRARLDAAAEPPVPFGGRVLRAEDRGMRRSISSNRKRIATSSTSSVSHSLSVVA